jgi:hypothetical protein
MVLALLITTFMTMVPPGTATADVLLIEEVRQSDRMELPDNGISKADVKARFGDPVNTHNPVGDPPITRWDYSGWSVYFEYDLVLFTVLHKGQVLDKNQEESG